MKVINIEDYNLTEKDLDRLSLLMDIPHDSSLKTFKDFKDLKSLRKEARNWRIYLLKDKTYLGDTPELYMTGAISFINSFFDLIPKKYFKENKNVNKK